MSMACMQAPHANNCPHPTQFSPISHGLLHLENKPAPRQPETTQTSPTQQDGTFLRSEFLNLHSDRPRSSPHAHSPNHPESPRHSIHAHTFTYPTTKLKLGMQKMWLMM